MKKFILFLILVFFVSSFYNSNAQVNNQLKWVHPKPQGNYLRWVKRFDANNWYAIGYGGTFLKTHNVGNTWTVVNNIPGVTSSGSYIAFYDAHFFDLNTGIVCGANGKISRTTNGGTSWNTMTVASSTWYDLHFINSNTGFVAGASSNKVYKTTNKGLNWTSIGLTLTATSYGIYAWDANNIIVCSSSGNVVKTTNGGTTWTTINTGTTASLYKINFINNSTGFVCGASGKILLSPNGGASWIDVSSGTSSTTKYDIDFGPLPPVDDSRYLFQEDFTTTTFPPPGWLSVNVLGSNQWYRYTSLYHSAPACARISYQSTGGEDWLITPQIVVSPGDSLVFWARRYYTSSYPPDSLIVRLSTTNTALTSFTNIIGKLNVNSIPTSWGRYAYTLNSYTGDVYLAFQHKDVDGNGVMIDDVSVGLNTPPPTVSVYITGDAANIYKSTNLGTNWSTVAFRPAGGQPVSSAMYSTDLTPSATDQLVTVGAYGLFNERFNASTRIQYCNRQTASTMYDVWAENGYGKVIAVGSSGNLLISVNGGNTWTRRNYSSSTWNSISMINSTTGWIAGSSGRTYRTVDGGANFTEVTNTTTSTLYEVVFANANTGWIFGSSGTICRTTNGGSSWTTQTAPGVTSYIRGSHFVNQYTGWLCGNSGKVSKTNDAGEMWTAQNPNSTATLYDINMINQNTGWLCGASSTVRKTNNGGTNWNTLTIPYTGVTLYKVHFVDQNNGMVVGNTGRTFRTRDGGSSWEFENTSASHNNSVYLTSTDTGFVCGTYGNIFKYQENLTGIGNFTNEIPETYKLHQNYPNPFNPSTTIMFGLPEKGIVTLKVYDITGRVVSSLFNNEGLSAGTFEYTFDGSNLSSSVYFYSLAVDGKLIDTKKMMLLK